MTMTQTAYPIFVPNQVLTDLDLNQAVAYLNGQSYLTRTHLIGVGIVDGLRAQVQIVTETTQAQQTQQIAKIRVSAGYGITSEGDVIALSEERYFSQYETNKTFSPAWFQREGRDDDVSPQGETNSASGNAIELVESNGTPLPSDLQQMQELLTDQVLVVVYETQESQDDTCWLSYDRSSRSRSFNLRFFLLPCKSPEDGVSADGLLTAGYSLESLSQTAWDKLYASAVGDGDFKIADLFAARHRYLEGFNTDTEQFQALAPQIRRFGTGSDAEGGIDLESITDYEAFRASYIAVCEDAIAAIKASFPQLFQFFSPFFSPLQPRSDLELSQLVLSALDTALDRIRQPISPEEATETGETLAKISDHYSLQYFYDYLSQLIAAYYELAEAAFELMAQGVPENSWFPKFLMLGKIALPEPEQPEDVDQKNVRDAAYRSHFVQAPAAALGIEQVAHLYRRLVLLCQPDSFALPLSNDATLRITPSRDRSYPLGAQAIPPYLNTEALDQSWSFDAYRRGRRGHHPEYIDSDLSYRLDGYNLYRIEGHLGKDKQEMLNQILEERQRWNLAFDVLTVKVGQDTDLDDIDSPVAPPEASRLETARHHFQGMGEIFQTVWQSHETDWSNNALISTLKQVFFDQDDPANIVPSQLYDPLLTVVRNSEDRWDDWEQADAPGHYRLYITSDGQRLGQVLFTGPPDEAGKVPSRTEQLNLSGSEGEDLRQAQRDIIDKLATALAEQVAYGLERSAENPSQFQVSLTLIETVSLPINSSSRTDQPQVSVTLLSASALTVGSSGNSLLVEPQKFRTFATLYGLLRDVPATYAEEQELGFALGDHGAAVDYLRALDPTELIEAYYRQSDTLARARRFFEFATQHPGLEHLGGVPKGGTLVLAYADRTAVATALALEDPNLVNPSATNIVVGDFCLPYRYQPLLPSAEEETPLQLQPIVLLTATRFCADDSEPYEVLLYPPNGSLKGEGLTFTAGKYYFQPSQVHPDVTHDTPIVLTYAANGRDSALVVTVNPLPDSSFRLGVTDSADVCANDGPIPLLPSTPGGSFSVVTIALDEETGTESPGTLAVQTEKPIQNGQFLPKTVALEDRAVVVTIRYALTSEHGCSSHQERAIRVHPQPAIEFTTVDDGGNEVSSVCASEKFVSLEASPLNGVFRACDQDQDISARVLQGNRFLPGNVSFGDALQKTITLEYAVVNRQGCHSRLEREITVVALPDASFHIENGPEQNIVCTDAEPLLLKAATAGGSFKAMDGLTDISATALTDRLPEDITVSDSLQALIDQTENPTLFLPGSLNIASAQQKSITLIYAVSHDSDSPQPCPHHSQQQITVVAPPDASFRIGPANRTEFCHSHGPVPLIPWIGGGSFSCSVPDCLTQENTHFDPGGADLSSAEEISVTLTYTIADAYGCTSTQDQSVIVYALPSVSLAVDGDSDSDTIHLCSNQAPVPLQPKPANGLFRALDNHQNIAARLLSGDRLLPGEVSFGTAAAKAIVLEYGVTNDRGCTGLVRRNIVVHRAPQGDFQAVIHAVSSSGFSVRVFNIQPEDTALGFSWATPQSLSRQTPDGGEEISEPGSSEFIVSYGFDQLDASQVSITLQITSPSDQGGCSHSVTKTIDVPLDGIQSLSLLEMTGGSSSRIPLADGDTFSTSELSGSYVFEAVTVGQVGSVTFTYEPPDDDTVESPTLNAPEVGHTSQRFLMLDDSGRYWPQQALSPGIHRVEILSFREADRAGLEGVPLTVSFSIVSDDSGGGENDSGDDTLEGPAAPGSGPGLEGFTPMAFTNADIDADIDDGETGFTGLPDVAAAIAAAEMAAPITAPTGPPPESPETAETEASDATDPPASPEAPDFSETEAPDATDPPASPEAPDFSETEAPAADEEQDILRLARGIFSRPSLSSLPEPASDPEAAWPEGDAADQDTGEESGGGTQPGGWRSEFTWATALGAIATLLMLAWPGGVLNQTGPAEPPSTAAQESSP